MDTSNITFYGADSWNKKKNSFEYDPVSFDPKIIPERDRARGKWKETRARARACIFPRRLSAVCTHHDTSLSIKTLNVWNNFDAWKGIRLIIYVQKVLRIVNQRFCSQVF